MEPQPSFLGLILLPFNVTRDAIATAKEVITPTPTAPPTPAPAVPAPATPTFKVTTELTVPLTLESMLNPWATLMNSMPRTENSSQIANTATTGAQALHALAPVGQAMANILTLQVQASQTLIKLLTPPQK